MRRIFIIIFLFFTINTNLYSVKTLISFTGQFRDSSDTPYNSGSLKIEIRSNGSSGTIVWGPYNFNDVLDSQGSFNIILGKVNPLNLDPGKEYNMIVRVDYNSATYLIADRVFGDDNPSGDIIIVHSGANDVYLLNNGDTMQGSLTVESNLLVKGTLTVLGNTYLGSNLYVTNQTKFHSNVVLTNGNLYIKDSTKSLELRVGAGLDVESINAPLYLNYNTRERVQCGSPSNPVTNVDIYGATKVHNGRLTVVNDASNKYIQIFTDGADLDIEAINKTLHINNNSGEGVEFGNINTPVSNVKIYGPFYIIGTNGNKLKLSGMGDAVDIDSQNDDLWINNLNKKRVFISGNTHIWDKGFYIIDANGTNVVKQIMIYATNGCNIESDGTNLVLNNNGQSVQVGSSSANTYLEVHNRIYIRETNIGKMFGEGKNNDLTIKQKESGKWMRFVNGGSNSYFVWMGTNGDINDNPSMVAGSEGGLAVKGGIGIGDNNDNLFSANLDSITGGDGTDFTIEQRQSAWMRFVNANEKFVWLSTNDKMAMCIHSEEGKLHVRNGIYLADNNDSNDLWLYGDTDKITGGNGTDLELTQLENGYWMRFRNNGTFVWLTNGDASSQAVMWLEKGGNLHIKGSLTQNDSGNPDLAECFKKGEENLEPGDVLEIGKDGKLIRCKKANSSAIAGVYSEKPAILLGAGGEIKSKEDIDNPKLPADKIPVALVGQVKVKVCDYNGSIKPGDLLTSSPIPGYAMKAKPVEINGIKIYRTGTIIGKALESLKKGKGKILVLIHLQ